MKKLLIIVIVLGAIIWAVMYYSGAPKVTAPYEAASTETADTTESIEEDLGSVDVGELDADFDGLDAGVKSL